MCFDILKDPVSAITKAKKRNPRKTWLALFESSILLGLASAVLVLRGGYSQAAATLAVTSAVSVFVAVFVLSLVLGFLLKIIVNNLGGSGRYHEGLTSISYSLVPVSVAMLAGSVLFLLPGGVILSSLSIAIGLASGISLLYRAIKELFKTDLITALVAISVLVIVLFVSASASLGFSSITRLGTLLV